MLVIILVWIYSGTLSILFGHLFLKNLFQNQVSPKSPNTIFQSFFTGFALINFIGSLLSLFLPTGLASNLILLAILAGSYLLTKTPLPTFNDIQISYSKKIYKYLLLLLVFVVIFGTAYITSGTVKNTDSYLYHAQSIHWIESYPAIKGLGNFFVRFAYNSSWFLQTALFSFSFLGGVSLHVMSGLLFTAFALLILYSAIYDYKNILGVPESIAGFMLLPLSLLTLGSELSSPSTDLPSALLIWTVIFFTYQYFRGSQQDHALKLTIIVTTLLAVTVKISVLPVLIVPAFFILQAVVKKKWKYAASLVLLSLACITPWIFRSVIQSGYLLYPVEATGLPVTWKISENILQEDVAHIRVWGFDKVLDNELVLSKSYIERIALWYRERTLNQKIMISGALLTPVLTGILTIFTEKKKTQYLIPFITYCAGLLYWLLISPNIRFGYSWLLIINVMFFGYSIHALSLLIRKRKNLLILANHLLFASLSFALLGMFALSMKDIAGNQAEPLSARLITQMDYLPRSANNCLIYHTEYEVFCAKEYYECGYHNFPCFPWEPTIGMYDENNLLKGFFPVTDE